MPIPAGIALPSITQGALIGRFYGEILRWYLPATQPQAFSIVGAAAFGGVMTRCTSISLLLVELTGKIPLVIGIVTANMFSYAIANLFTMSAFNTAMTINKMPYLPFMFYSSLYRRRVGEFMDTSIDIIEEKAKLFEIIEFFAKKELYTNDEFIPIVEDNVSDKVIGSVRSWNMLEYICLVCDAIGEECKLGNTSELVEKFNRKMSKFGQDSDAASIEMFMKMPERFKQWINEIRNNEAKLDFSGSGLTWAGGNAMGTSLSDKWLEAFDLVRQRWQEKENGIQESQIQVMDEYYCFVKMVVSKMVPDWNNPVIKFNSYPICVDKSTKIIKVHFLFQMLGISAIFVCNRGKFEGKLNLEKFLNLRYTEQTYM